MVVFLQVVVVIDIKLSVLGGRERAVFVIVFSSPCTFSSHANVVILQH